MDEYRGGEGKPRGTSSGCTVLIDCVTLWATNFFFDLEQDIDRALQEMKAELSVSRPGGALHPS